MISRSAISLRMCIKFLVVSVAMLLTVSCATTYLVGRQTVDPDAENVTFTDDQPIYTSEIEGSVLEFQFVPRETVYWGRDSLGEPIQGSFFLQNLSNSAFDYRPGDVWLVVWAEGQSSAEDFGGLVAVYLYRGADDIAFYVEDIARASARPDYVNTTGGYYTYLSGGTIGESIIAGNQARAERARAQRNAQAQQTRITEALDEFLLGRTTIEPGELISGGVGFVDAGWVFVPAAPATDELIQAWRDGFYGPQFADTLEPGTPALEQIIAKPTAREAIQARSDRAWAEAAGETDNTGFGLTTLVGPALELYPSSFSRVDEVSGLLLVETESGTHRIPVTLDVRAVTGDEAAPVTFPYTP